MAAPTVQLSSSELVKKMALFEKLTGSSIQDSLRRQARLLAVDLCRRTPPYGLDDESKKLGERAIQNDILRVYKQVHEIQTKHPTALHSFRNIVDKNVVQDERLRKAMLAAIDHEATHGSSNRKQRPSKSKGLTELQAILKKTPGFNKLHADENVDPSLHARARNARGRVRKGWKTRTLVYNSGDLQSYLAKKQDLVGLTKAAWAKAALMIQAPVGDALREIPSFITRHMGRAGAKTQDDSGASHPKIMLGNEIPWASSALRASTYASAVRASRKRFVRSLDIAINAIVKKQNSTLS